MASVGGPVFGAELAPGGESCETSAPSSGFTPGAGDLAAVGDARSPAGAGGAGAGRPTVLYFYRPDRPAC